MKREYCVCVLFLIFAFISSCGEHEKDKNDIETEIIDSIHININEDIPRSIDNVRKTLIQILWIDGKLPTEIPLENGRVDSEQCSGLPFTESEKLIINMNHGINSTIYLFIPRNPNGNAVIYHQGHSGHFLDKGYNSIKNILADGYAVAGMSMPLVEPNQQKVSFYGNEIKNHDDMGKYLNIPDESHPVSYFISPVIMVVNYLTERMGYENISMVGISGGGWTTVMSAAVDTRIQRSYSVAGSVPLPHRKKNLVGEGGDYEQKNMDIYKNVSYMDLYIMGSYGTTPSGLHRREVAIHNDYDPCCYASDIVKQFNYENLVCQFGCDFSIIFDGTHSSHSISSFALEVILENMRNELQKVFKKSYE